VNFGRRPVDLGEGLDDFLASLFIFYKVEGLVRYVFWMVDHELSSSCAGERKRPVVIRSEILGSEMAYNIGKGLVRALRYKPIWFDLTVIPKSLSLSGPVASVAGIHTHG